MTKVLHRAQGSQAALQKHEQHQSKHIQNEVGFLGKQAEIVIQNYHPCTTSCGLLQIIHIEQADMRFVS